MNQIKPDPLTAATQEFEQILNADLGGRKSQWAGDVHGALGKLVGAIQTEVQAAEKSMATVGEINPDFQNAPTAERHIRATREQFIQLVERAHELRAVVRKACDDGDFDAASLRRRGQEICTDLAKVRRAESEFLLETLNSNPGAGE